MQKTKKILVGAILLLGATVGSAFAQDQLKTTEWTTYDAWGNKHKTVYTELRSHPDWAYDQGYISKHHELKAYYDEHPTYWNYVRTHHDWVRHHPGWESTTTTTTVTH